MCTYHDAAVHRPIGKSVASQTLQKKLRLENIPSKRVCIVSNPIAPRFHTLADYQCSLASRNLIRSGHPLIFSVNCPRDTVGLMMAGRPDQS